MPQMQIHNLSLKYLRRDIPNFLDVRGSNAYYPNMKVKYELFDYALNHISEGMLPVEKRLDSNDQLQFVIPAVTSKLALKAVFTFLTGSNAKL